MGRARKIELSLFEQSLIDLINTSVKIFPLSKYDLENNLNPNNYEYGRYDRGIYTWYNEKWEYIIADDINVSFNDLKDIPTSFKPSEHIHSESDIIDLNKYSKAEIDNKLSIKANKSELHEHNNKSLLDTITNILVDSWNSAVEHTKDIVKHITQIERARWNTVIDKADKTYVDSELSEKANIFHNHDGAYYRKEEVDLSINKKSDKDHNHDTQYYTKVEMNNFLNGKSNITHKHKEADISDLDKYSKNEIDIMMSDKSNISHTHSELHTHTNKSILEKVIETEIHEEYDISNLQYIEDIKNGYTEGHAHSNLDVLNNISTSDLSNFESAYEHTLQDSKHVNNGDRLLWNTVIDKSNIGHNHDDIYSLISHNHDTEYYTILEMNEKLDNKSDKDHTHIDKADKTYVEQELNKKADNTTVSYHTNDLDIHVTKSDKEKLDSIDIGANKYIHPLSHDASMIIVSRNNSNLEDELISILNELSEKSNSSHKHNKSDIVDFPTSLSQFVNNMGYITANDVPPGITIGTVKPTDGSMWYEVIQRS